MVAQDNIQAENGSALRELHETERKRADARGIGPRKSKIPQDQPPMLSR